MASSEKSNLASYVVRIYRRTSPRNEHPDTIAGLVENVEDKQRRAFHSMVELWDILCTPTTHQSAPKRNTGTAASHAASHDDEGRR